MAAPSAPVLAVTALIAVAAGASGCSDQVKSFSVPDPPTTIAVSSSTVATLPAGLATVPENTVPGSTTTTVPEVKPGPDALTGTVYGPQGPVGGATVEIDRFVGDEYRSATTTTATDGSWSFRGILGGRYRVRAWQAPDLDMTTPQVLFVSSDQEQPLALELTQFQSPQVQMAINPTSPTVGQPANLVVQVDKPTVGTDGLETSVPDADQSVSLVDGSDWLITGSNPEVTDSAGQVTFQVSCTVAGSDPLSAQVGTGSPVTLQMPTCQSAPATTPGTSTDGAGGHGG